MKSILYLSLSFLVCMSLEAKEAQSIKSMKEFKEVMSQQKPAVIMFHAPWCGACKEMSGALNQAATQLGSDAIVIKIDVENETMHELTDLFCINAIPTIVVKHTGRVLAEDLVSSVKSLTKKPTLEPKKNEPTKKETPEKKAEPRAPQTKAPQRKTPAQQPIKKQQGSSKK